MEAKEPTRVQQRRSLCVCVRERERERERERGRIISPRAQRRGEERRGGTGVSEQHRQRCSARAGACVCSSRGEVCLQQYMARSFNAAQYVR